MKASYFAVLLQAFYTKTKSLKHSSIVCTVGLHWLYFVRMWKHGLALRIQPMEFSLSNMSWTLSSIYGMLWWSQMELKCTQWDCKSFEQRVLVSLLVYMMKNCYSNLFPTQFEDFGITVSCSELQNWCTSLCEGDLPFMGYFPGWYCLALNVVFCNPIILRLHPEDSNSQQV